MQDAKAAAIVQKKAAYAVADKALQEQMDTFTNVAARELNQQRTEMRQVMDAAKATLDQERAETIATASDKVHNVEVIKQRDIKAAYETHRQALSDEAAAQADAIAVQRLEP